MCAIIDANVTFEVFGKSRADASKEFRAWLEGGRGTLVVGGENLTELTHNGNSQKWFQEARRLTRRVRQVNNAQIKARQEWLRRSGMLRSDDEHVLALALVSGARLLYSNDGDLKDDFSNVRILRKPRGRVYTTRRSKSFTPTHRKLLNRKNLCGSRSP